MIAWAAWFARIAGVFGRRPSREFMLALLTRRRNMLKIERFFNTFREHLAVYTSRPTETGADHQGHRTDHIRCDMGEKSHGHRRPYTREHFELSLKFLRSISLGN